MKANQFEFTWKEETGFIILEHGSVKIPENLSSIIHSDLSELLAENILIKENDMYILKIGQEFKIKLKLKTKIRANREKQRYSIEFGIGMGIFSRPIFKLKNLNHAKYNQILQMLEAQATFSQADMEEFIEFGNDRISSKNSDSKAIWGIISLFTLFFGLFLLEIRNEKNTTVIYIYYILVGIYFLYSLIIPWDLAFHRERYFAPERQRKIHIRHTITRNLYLGVITFVYLFVFFTTR